MMRSKRVFGPSKSGKEEGKREILTYWKLFCVSGENSDFGEDEQVHSILLVQIFCFCLVVPIRLEKWRSDFSWADISRVHLRRDKVGLFLSYCWFFGDGSEELRLLVSVALFNGQDDATDSISSLESKTGGEEELRKGPGVESEAEPLLPCKFQEPEVEPPRPLRPRIFTSTAINSSIAASENFRLLCSASIALLVILSHGSGHLGGNIINRSMPSRPLYLVLLNDITIVLGLLLCRNDGVGEKAVRETSSSMEVGGWENRLGMALVFQKAVAAIFMDCSVYVLLLVSGLSLLQ